MIRLLNFCCFAVTALACLALYHVSEQTRVAGNELKTVSRQIADQEQQMKVLQADWVRVSDPGRIQQLAAQRLGIADAPAIALASLELLPRRGQAKDTEEASAVAQPNADPRLHLASLRSGE